MRKEWIMNPIPVPLSNRKSKKERGTLEDQKQMEAIWSYPLG